MGPVRYMASQVFERKHKSLKNLSNKANNFKNITKTISYRHQAEIVYHGHAYTQELDCGKLSVLDLAMLSESEKSAISAFNYETNEPIYEIQHLNCNNFTYRRGLAILYENSFFCIERIFVIGSEYYFLCQLFDYLHFHDFTHSLVVEKNVSENIQIVDFREMREKVPYDVKTLKGRCHILADTLQVKHVITRYERVRPGQINDQSVLNQ